MIKEIMILQRSLIYLLFQVIEGGDKLKKLTQDDGSTLINSDVLNGLVIKKIYS